MSCRVTRAVPPMDVILVWLARGHGHAAPTTDRPTGPAPAERGEREHESRADDPTTVCPPPPGDLATTTWETGQYLDHLAPGGRPRGRGTATTSSPLSSATRGPVARSPLAEEMVKGCHSDSEMNGQLR